MIEPLTALGLAANIVQLVESGMRVIDAGREIASQGSTQEQQHIKRLAAETSSLCDQIKKQETQILSRSRSSAQSAQNTHTFASLATQTKGVANNLEELLAHLEVKAEDETGQPPAKRKRASTSEIARKLFRGLWDDKEIVSLKSRMLDLQRQMLLALANNQSVTTEELLHSFGTLSDRLEHDRIERLKEYEILLLHVDKTFAGNGLECSDLLQHLRGLASQAQSITQFRTLLKHLQFDELSHRRRGIAEAHQQSFSWIWDLPDSDFSSWLSSKDGVYWITGKPGSGKSTLMKYITSQQRTRQLLKQWAGGHEVILATHFFWNAGSPLQKSRIGLLRTLLYHVVHESPELGPRLFPEWFSASGSSATATDFSLSELCQAIRDLESTTAPGVRLCFFIDGLDEFVGEHIDLVELVSDLAKCPYVKICVSSRPWNVFERAYHGRVNGELAVQDFTTEDIRSYVQSKLLQNIMFVDLRSCNLEECDRLVESIVRKAQGVFLWVVLVVQSLVRGLTNDDDLTILHARVDSYPASLSAYFRRMLDRIEGVYLSQSARLLLVASAAEQSLPFWSPRCLELEAEDIRYALALCEPPSLKDARYAFGCDCPLPPVRLDFDGSPYPALSTIKHSCFYFFGAGARLLPRHLVKLRRYLDARCGDLLELSPDGIAFIHRTARDFIFHGGLAERLETLAGSGYDVGISLTNIAVAGAKRESDPAISALKAFMDTDARTFACSKAYLQAVDPDTEEFQPLRNLDTTLISYDELVKRENMDLYEELRSVGGGVATRVRIRHSQTQVGKSLRHHTSIT